MQNLVDAKIAGWIYQLTTRQITCTTLDDIKQFWGEPECMATDLLLTNGKSVPSPGSNATENNCMVIV